MKNSGYVVALDKSVGKIQQIQQNRDLQGFSNIFPHAFDSRKVSYLQYVCYRICM